MLEEVSQLVRQAGAEIMRFYGQPIEVEVKADDSPLTLADKAAHEVLVGGLNRLDASIPVLSEETSPEEYAQRSEWTRFWLVDPLDGTKEFVKQRGEFTVNVALIENGAPVLGVVYSPPLDTLYAARVGEGAYRERGGERQEIRVNGPTGVAPVVVASRSHPGPVLESLFQARPDLEVKSMGSSLKFCLVAEGSADLYPRISPTMEWDTAAAQAVVEAAGGAVLDLEGAPLRYNKGSLKNPFLVTLGDAGFGWRDFLPLEAAREAQAAWL